MRQKGFAVFSLLLVVAIIAIVGFVVYQNTQLRSSILELKNTVANNNKLPATNTPKPTATNLATPTASPSPTPSPKSFEEEEILMRKTLAGFEMYIGASNTAGALSFFTPPKSTSAKERYENIRSKNLPYGLKSWSFVVDYSQKLAVEEVKGGYRVRVNECRTNGTCLILFFDLIRDLGAENGFLVDRYYTSQYAYQNNLGEEIKYQGFGF